MVVVVVEVVVLGEEGTGMDMERMVRRRLLLRMRVDMEDTAQRPTEDLERLLEEATEHQGEEEDRRVPLMVGEEITRMPMGWGDRLILLDLDLAVVVLEGVEEVVVRVEGEEGRGGGMMRLGEIGMTFVVSIFAASSSLLAALLLFSLSVAL